MVEQAELSVGKQEPRKERVIPIVRFDEPFSIDLNSFLYNPSYGHESKFQLSGFREKAVEGRVWVSSNVHMSMSSRGFHTPFGEVQARIYDGMITADYTLVFLNVQRASKKLKTLMCTISIGNESFFSTTEPERLPFGGSVMRYERWMNKYELDHNLPGCSLLVQKPDDILRAKFKFQKV